MPKLSVKFLRVVTVFVSNPQGMPATDRCITLHIVMWEYLLKYKICIYKVQKDKYHL